jgi:deoxyribodipyrimidine photo-lyase
MTAVSARRPVRTLVWFRGKDLRLADHAPLVEAIRGGEVIPLFVLDPYFFAPARARRAAHRIQCLLEALSALAADVRRRGSRLVLVKGKSVSVVPRLARAWRVDRVVGHAWAAPVGRVRDRLVAERLRVPFDLYDGETLITPGSLRSGAGSPYVIFTAFARAFHRTALIGAPFPPPRWIPPLPADVHARVAPLPTLASLGIDRNPRLPRGGEQAARARLRRFLQGATGRAYDHGRHRLDLDGTSRLSCDLKFGTLSVRTVWTAASRHLCGAARQAFLNELVWREFMHSTVVDRPDVIAGHPFRPAFESFPWRYPLRAGTKRPRPATESRRARASDRRAWRAWTQGTTGYPVVDAAARQLIAEGFVHNRARMIAASFLAKQLLIDYRRGEAHYMRYLADGDWANNNGGWQWSAGCGADAQPYFRVFNPVTQGMRWDPSGRYVRRWVPELARLPDAYVHAPWMAPASVLRDAGIVLGRDYPRPIVEHQEARRRFLLTAARALR